MVNGGLSLLVDRIRFEMGFYTFLFHITVCALLFICLLIAFVRVDFIRMPLTAENQSY